MSIKVITELKYLPSNAKNKFYLLKEKWNDWYAFETLFDLFYFDKDGNRIECGGVKIGQKGLQGKKSEEYSTDDNNKGLFRTPLFPSVEFDCLPDDFFSLGQEENYYEILGKNPETQEILRALCDCAIDLKKFDENINESAMQESLLRDISPAQVRNRFHRLANGNAKLTMFSFSYTYPNGITKISFDVKPNDLPPSNVQVIIGRNGVGKTSLMKNIAKSILQYDPNQKGNISFEKGKFSSLIFVSFSIFDKIDIEKKKIQGMKYSKVGYEDENGDDTNWEDIDIDDEISIRNKLANIFIKGLKKCNNGLRKERWLKAIKTLENDPLFSESKFSEVIDLPIRTLTEQGKRLFKELSSGHAILLLIITKLIELVEERTVVLIDEPEGHLHPPLLAAFIRCLSEILISRNAVAVISTHSPIVLQEVPQKAAWILQRFGNEVAVAHPQIETFGENIGVLNNEVFKFEISNSGWNKMLCDIIDKYPMESYESILGKFNGELGTEAKMILRSLIAIKKKEV